MSVTKSDKIRWILFQGQHEAKPPDPLDTSTWVAVPGTNSVDSYPIELTGFKYFSAMFKADSATGTADVKFEILGCHFDEDSLFSSIEVQPGVTSINIGETWKISSIEPIPVPFIKFRVTGNAGNPSDTLVFGSLFLSD